MLGRNNHFVAPLYPANVPLRARHACSGFTEKTPRRAVFFTAIHGTLCSGMRVPQTHGQGQALHFASGTQV